MRKTILSRGVRALASIDRPAQGGSLFAMESGLYVVMKITFLGHAGFDVRNAGGGRLVCDPWLTDAGAFLNSWYQFPQNHHLADSVASLDPEHDLLYISHHHRDHFDRDFLRRLNKDIQLCVPRFVRRHFVNELKSLGFHRIREMLFGDSVEIHGFRLTLFVDDCYTNEDSGILIEADGAKFLNMNDCRAYDRLATTSLRGLDLFTIQFSGASWFPSVYDYTDQERDQHSHFKNQRTFHNISNLINRLEPRLYVPSAGPPCFLDSALQRFNHGQPSPFPDAREFFEILKELPRRFEYIFPSDVIEIGHGLEPEVRTLSGMDATFYLPENKRRYIQDYADRMKARCQFEAEGKDPWPDLLSAAQQKVAALPQPLAVPRPLVFSVTEHPTQPDRHVLCDLNQRTAAAVDGRDLPADIYQYSFTSRVLTKFFETGEMWEDLMLSLRFRIHRSPDEFDPIIADFVRLQLPDLRRYPFAHHEEERIRRTIGGVEYEFDRYCPHNNGDLLHADVVDGHLVCPRHGWCFSLSNAGACSENHTTINCIPVEHVDTASSL